MRLIQSSTREIQRARALFCGAFCLYLSGVEALFPHPIPFLHYGFANIPLLIALGQISGRGYFFAVVVKIVGQGLISSTLLSPLMILSGVGSFSAAVVAWVAYKFLGRWCSLVGLSVLVAFVSDCCRLLTATLFLQPTLIKTMAPFFLLGGFFCALFTGAIAQGLRSSTNLAQVPLLPTVTFKVAPLRWGKTLLLSLPLVVVIFAACWGNPFFCLAVFLLLTLTTLLLKISNRWKLTLSVFLTLFLFSLLTPEGEIWGEWGIFRLTEGAFLRGIQQASTFCSFILASRIALKELKRREFSGIIGQLFAYLQAFWTLPLKKKDFFHRSYPQEVAAALKGLDDPLL